MARKQSHEHALDCERLQKLQEEQQLEALRRATQNVSRLQRFEEARQELHEERLYRQEAEK